MNRFIASIALVAFLVSSHAWADPGLIAFTNTKTSTDASASLTTVKVKGGTLLYTFTTSTNSVTFDIISPIGEICLDTDINSTSTAGSGRVDLWRSANPSNLLSVNGFMVASLPPNRCYDVSSGTYWLEVSSGTGGASAQVSITGRSI